MPHATRIPHVRHLGLALQQARDLLGRGLGRLTQLVTRWYENETASAVLRSFSRCSGSKDARGHTAVWGGEVDQPGLYPGAPVRSCEIRA